MKTPERLLARLDALGRALEQDAHALALIGLGSVGRERERLDEYSDLDFFVIVNDGHKLRFIEQLDWLAAPSPLIFCFQNTKDGCKALSEDGIFYEFAVFVCSELAGIPFAPGRVIWKRPGVSDDIAIPLRSTPPPESSSREWNLGEALSNLYVGLCRYRRGEKLSAARFVQQYAVDRVLALMETETGPDPTRDPFSIERRFELRHPREVTHLASFIQGYDRTPESAAAILDFLATRFDLPPGMVAALREQIRAAAVDISGN